MATNNQVIARYWVESTNKLLTKLGLDNIGPDEFTNLIVSNHDGNKTVFTVICAGKMLVLSVNGNKITGGWKHYTE